MTLAPHPEAGTLPIRKAAGLLGIHPNTLRAWADQGRIRCLRVNARGDRRFAVADLEAFLHSAATPAPGLLFVSSPREGGGTSPTGPLPPIGRTSPASQGPPSTREPPARTPPTSRTSPSSRSSRAGSVAPPDGAAASAAAHWEAQIESIAKLGTRLNGLRTVSQIGMAICLELRQLIDYHNVRVYRVHGDSVVPVGWRGEIGAYTGEVGDQLRVRIGHGITGWVARHGIAQYLPDAARDPRSATIPGTEEDLPESMLLAPMLFEDRVIGVIVLSKLGVEQFGADDLRYLEIYASMAAQAMANADISERLRAQELLLQRELDSQRELLRVTESILSNLDPTAVVEEMADSLSGLIPADDLAIYVHEPQRAALRPLLARGSGAATLMARPLPDGRGLAAEALQTGEARRVQVGGTKPAALIMAPLRGRERVLGVLMLRRNGSGVRFELKELDLIRLFAAHVSIALQNAIAHRAVELRAQTDALTGLKNHGTFRDDLARAVERGHPFALLMVDLDDFKAQNDRFGHEHGNGLLQAIAIALRTACRGSDEVYRYGGDEFALLLQGSGEAGALEVAERVRMAVREARAPGQRRAARMRCSVGVACYPADAQAGTELLLAADQALYAAKGAGRDRTATVADGIVPRSGGRPVVMSRRSPRAAAAGA